MDEQQKKSFLALIQLDAGNLYRRIVDRKEDYLMVLHLKRTRKHFAHIFHCKYPQMNLSDLKELRESTISSIDYFYRKVNELQWYLLHTEDLPAMVSDHTEMEIKKLHSLFDEAMQNLSIEREGGPPPLDFKE